MSQTTPPTIDPVPEPAPQRNDRTTFSGRVDAFITWLSAAVAQFSAVANNVYTNAVDCYNSALSSATYAQNSANSATDSANSASSAALSANVLLWVSGSTIQQYSAVISPANGRTYRRLAATGSGTTDPSIDPNYVLISVGQWPRLKVSHRLSTGTNAGGSSTGFNTRPLNTVEINTINGASLSGNLISLPTGTYNILGRAPARASTPNENRHKVSLYNQTDSADILLGSNSYIGAGEATQTDSHMRGQFTISSTKSISLRHFISNATAIDGLGINVGATGQLEIYAEIDIEKVG